MNGSRNRRWAAAVLCVGVMAAAGEAESAGKRSAKTSRGTDERLAKYLSVQHPRLLVTPERLARIRQGIRQPGSHFQLAHAAMVKRAAGDPKTVWDGAGYWPVYASRELAFLSLLAEDPAEKRRYAAAAAKALPPLGYVQHGGFRSKSLGHGMATFGVALTYDWAYNEWTDAERAKAEKLLEYFLAHWRKYRRVSEGKGTGYNFYGVLYGAEAMLHLATGGEKTAKRFPTVVRVLAEHLAAVGGELGAHHEGIGYTEYPMGFGLPAAIALAHHGQPGPLKAAKTHAFWKLNLFVQTFMTSYNRKFVQYGVSHRSGPNEGFASCVAALCPPEQLGYYRWFYDRHMGRLATAEAGRRYDCHRGNTPFALLFYPDAVEPKDPTGVIPPAAVDNHGYVFFRNRWRDANDIQAALIACGPRTGGWAQNEHLDVRLMAFDTHFLGGPGKQRDVENYTTLLVDGALAPKGKRPHQPGKITAFEPTVTGGYAIVDGSDHYAALGVKTAARHLLVRFSDPAKNAAVLSTLDDITSDVEHAYTWQANLGPEGRVKLPTPPAPKRDAKPASPPLPPPNDDDIVSTSGAEAGRPFFLLTGRNGFVKGWVLSHADARVTTGDPLRVEAKGQSAKLWIVLYAGQGKPPVAAIAGEGMASTLTVAGVKVRWDGKANRVVCQ